MKSKEELLFDEISADCPWKGDWLECKVTDELCGVEECGVFHLIINIDSDDKVMR